MTRHTCYVVGMAHRYVAAPFHEIPLCHVLLSSVHEFSAYHCTDYCISYSYSHDHHTHSCHAYILQLHMPVLFLSSCHMDHHTYYMYYYFMFPYSWYMIVTCYWYGYSCYWTCELLICDMWEAHIYCSRSRYIVHVILFMLYCSWFSLYCSTLSTKLRSSYHVTRIMYSSYSCYIVYLI